jgi:hypothetical protein
MGPRAGLDAVEQTNISQTFRDCNGPVYRSLKVYATVEPDRDLQQCAELRFSLTSRGAEII